MTRRPQPFSFWRLLAVTGALVAGLVALDRFAPVPAAPWSDGPVSRIPDAIAALPPGEVESGQPVLSLVMDERDLLDPEHGILANVLEHGRDWERPGTIAYFDAGRLQFATGVGVRVHGGGSRRSAPRQGFRLYFRREYGARQVPPGILFSPDAQPIRHLVVHNDVRDGRRFVNPLAYDISRAMGAITPDTLPARFYVNGEYYGVFVLTERFDEQYFQAHWGHDRVGGTTEQFQAFWEWSAGTRPLTMASVSEKADVENLARWFLSTAFAATRDAYQGPGQHLDFSTEAGRWFWVNWDMDGGLRAFDLDSYQDLLNRVDEGQRGRSHTEPRGHLLTTLFSDDNEFRTFYKRIFVAAMNHQATPEFLNRRYEYYRRASDRLRIEDTRFLRGLKTFLDRRPDFFWTLTEQWLNTGPRQTMTLAAPPDKAITIDGQRAADGFEGQYFPDLEILLAAEGDGFREWRVNGAVAGRDAALRLRVDTPTAVVAVYAGAAVPVARVPAPRTQPPPLVSPDEPAPPLAWAPIPAPADGQPFRLLTREVTVADYAAFAAAHGQRMPTQPSWWGASPSHPVVNVTWDEARAFCAAQGGRLPTAEEWQHASAIADVVDGIPPWGNGERREANLLGDRGSDRWEFTSPAGSFRPNRFGLHDMVGNVWEWTTTAHERSRPDYDVRVVLGGSWDTPARSFPRRTGLSRHGRHNLYVGFRCAS
jgi:hypothetical protein